MRLILTSAFLYMTSMVAHAAPLVAGGGFGAEPMKQCGNDLALLNQISGWQTSWPQQWSAIETAPADSETRRNALDYWAGADAALRNDIAALKSGAAAGTTAPKAVVARVLQQVDDLLRDLDKSGPADAIRDDDKFATAWGDLFNTRILPAIADYRNYLAGDYLAAAGEKSALARVKGGEECFSNAISWWTTLRVSPAEAEAIGARIISETKNTLVERDARKRRLSVIMKDLRRPVKGVSGDEIVTISEAALQRARSALPKAISAIPSSPIVVEEMAAQLQPSFPAGYYRPPSGGSSAAYIINPSRPGERRLLAEAIAFHEGIPGHHLFFAYPRAKATGEFNAGIVEGWAIYAEQVADELGVYSTERDREGMLAKRLWAASRLIVEPRLHDGRWTRADAIAFMAKKTTLPRTEIEIEVDRYLAMPGQSLSYALGYDAIITARKDAEARLGGAFDIKAFHDAILAPGVRTLDAMKADINAWEKTVSPSPAG